MRKNSEETKKKNRIRMKAWRERNHDRFRAAQKRWYLKYKDSICEKEQHRSRFKLYGVTEADYNNMMIDQEYKCKICGKLYNVDKKCFSVDHDHSTGEVRGLLCAHCNSALGWYEKNTNNIISYIENSKKMKIVV